MTENGEDHPASVERKTAWLKKSGFQHVACHWKHMNFAILSAHRASPGPQPDHGAIQLVVYAAAKPKFIDQHDV